LTGSPAEGRSSGGTLFRRCPDYPQVRRYLDGLRQPDAVAPEAVLSAEAVAQMSSLDNYLAFHEVDWDALPPELLVRVYVAVVAGGIPNSDAFRGQVERTLGQYDLTRVLSPDSLPALLAAADRPTNRPPDAEFRKALAEVRNKPCLVRPRRVHFQSPEARRVKPVAGPELRPLSAAEWAHAQAHPVFDDRGNRIPPPEWQVIQSVSSAGPFATLAVAVGMLNGDTAADTLRTLELFGPIDGLAAALAGVSAGRRAAPPVVRRPAPAVSRPARPATGRPRVPPRPWPAQVFPPAANDTGRPPTALTAMSPPRSAAAANDNAVAGGKPALNWTTNNGYYFAEWTDARGYRYKRVVGVLQDRKAPLVPGAHAPISKGTGDHAGHLVGRQFNGPDIPANLGAQNWVQNTGQGTEGTYHKMESGWIKQVRAGVTVAVDIVEVTKPGESRAFMRSATWTETTASGRTETKALDFANTHTPKSRAMRNVPPTVPGPQANNVLPFPGAAGPKPLSAAAREVLAQLTPAAKPFTSVFAPLSLTEDQTINALHELRAAGLAEETTGGTSFTQWRRK
jgi:hypothetical protein